MRVLDISHIFALLVYGLLALATFYIPNKDYYQWLKEAL
jgi:hypothetical protein